MRVDSIELHFAAKRERAKAIAAILTDAFVWLVSVFTHKGHKGHAARPHFAR
jgi:hypothetical protein